MAATADGIRVVLSEQRQQHTQQQHSTKTAADLDQHDRHCVRSGLLQRNISSHDLNDQAATCRWSAAGLWTLFVVGWILPPCWWVGVAVGLRGGKDRECLILGRKKLSAAQNAAWWACVIMSLVSVLVLLLVLPMWYGRMSAAQAGEKGVPDPSKVSCSGLRLMIMGHDDLV
jgi:hypothetical protein